MNTRYNTLTSTVRLTLILTLLSVITTVSAQNQEKKLVIGGAGPSTEITTILAGKFCETHPDYQITVPPVSIKHAGGLKWATQQGQIFGRLGRPLGAEDREQFPTARPIPFVKVKIGFAVRKDLGVTKLSAKQFKDIYQGKITNWKQLGGLDKKIILIGREKTESACKMLCEKYHFFSEANFIKTFKKDHEMILAIRQVPGGIGFAEKAALKKQNDLTVLDIEGFNCGLEIGLVYDAANENAEPVRLMKEFLNSKTWQTFLAESDLYGSVGNWKDHLDNKTITAIENQIKKIKYLASWNVVTQAVKKTNGDTDKKIKAAAKFLTSTVKKTPQYTRAILCDSKGHVVASSPKITGKWQEADRRFTECYNNGSGRIYVAVPEFDKQKKSCSTHIAVPVSDSSGTIGVFIMEIKI